MGVDEAGKTGYYRMLLAGIEKLDVVSISPARHFVMFDQPEKFAAALDRALETMVESQRRNERRILRHAAGEEAGHSRPGSASARPARRRTTASCWRRCRTASSSRPGSSKTTDIVHFFTASKAELAKNLLAWLKVLGPDAAIWVSWPKKTSKVPTDITEDTIRAVALPMGLVDIKVCAVDETWSGLKLVLRKELRAQ